MRRVANFVQKSDQPVCWSAVSVCVQERVVEAGGKVTTISVLGSDVTDYLRGEEAGLVELRGHLDGCVGVALVAAMMGRIAGALLPLSGARCRVTERLGLHLFAVSPLHLD